MAGSEQPPSAPLSTTQDAVFQWLRNLPLAPEYHPTLAEFQDPIAYIFKIEKEASKYGICKIVPPLLPSPKKTIISNINKSLSARPGSSSPPTFTTRQQQIGFCPRKPRPVQKPVWQSGESYTFQDFEAKAKGFERTYLKKYSKKQTPSSSALSPLEVETLYWKAAVDKPFSVEYANDMPGSAFSPRRRKDGVGVVAEGVSVGDTEWNMRGVSRAKGSLLRFMKEEIPGVTSPMVYVGMMFSWFAWHVEDHDLHSLNYMHMGAGKTWYGVPREAATAFEEVVRIHGYGGEINPLVMFAVLGEKTTVMSPEVFISAGVPCCRLVQNAGEFVVTFPRAYHSGFSHGFNCAEAANIATPEWLRVAKDAAIRRASINYPPMVSHFQLLYDLALELCSRIPVNISSKPRSSRLKDKQKGEGEALVKEQFVNNIIQNNDLLHILGKGSSIILLPQSSSDISVCSNLRVGSQLRENPSPGFPGHKDFMNSSKSSVSSSIMPDGIHEPKRVKGFFSVKAKFASLCERNRFASLNGNEFTHSANTGTEKGGDTQGDKLSDQRLFSCVTCGILSFDCLAIIQPSEAAARYLMSADCSFFNDWIVSSGVKGDGFPFASSHANASEQNLSARRMGNNMTDGLYDVPVKSLNQIQMVDQNIKMGCDGQPQGQPSALGLLALNYGNSSDSEEEHIDPDSSHRVDEISRINCSASNRCQNSASPSFQQECHDSATCSLSSSGYDHQDEAPPQTIGCLSEHGCRPANIKDRGDQNVQIGNLAFAESNGLRGTCKISGMASDCTPLVPDSEKSGRAIVSIEEKNTPFVQRSDEDSSRLHVFCLEHAVEVEQQLCKIGGVHIWLLCHPEYPRIEAEAKLVSEELGIDHLWNGTTFKDASKEDEERIKSALDSEEAIPGNGDWAVKLGINLFYSANLSRSPLYCKQMPYNSVIYNAFGRTSPAGSPTKFNVYERRPSKQKKVVAGKWCGKVWMSNQVHPFLAKQDPKDREQEPERNFHGWATTDEKSEKKPQSILKTESSLVTRKYTRKRKLAAGSGLAKKAKCPDTGDAASGDTVEDKCHKQGPRVKNGSRTKVIEKEASYDSPEDNFQQKHRRICKSKKGQSLGGENEDSDDSLGENIHQQYRRILRNKQAKLESGASYDLPMNNSQKQREGACRSNRDEYFQREGSISDDSLDNTINQWHGRVPKSKQAKFIERQEAISDDMLEESSHWPHGKVPRRRETKRFENEDCASDDSSEKVSHQQKKRMSRVGQAKHKEMEDVILDDSPDDTTKQHKGFSRSKQAKLMEREDAALDDSQNKTIYHRSRRILRSKQTKYVERENADSDDSLLKNFHQQQRQISKSRITEFSRSDDEFSDDFQEDDTQQRRRFPRMNDLQEDDTQQYRRFPRSKKARFIEKEDAVSDDLPHINQQLRKPLRSNLSKFKEMEDAVSDDMEDNSSQQHRRVLRSNQNKQITLRQLKQEAPRVVKRGMPRVIKKEPPQLIKQQKHLKQETPRHQAGKSEYSTRHFASNVDELDGGPSTRLRKRPSKSIGNKILETKPKVKQPTSGKNTKNALPLKAQAGRKNARVKVEDAEFQCDMEGCTMTFCSKQELAVHKRNVCPVKGCGKKFFSHKYLLQHRRVHIDDRPLKCPWKGCKMSFKWAWARTEHIRVHTGARPYVCAEEGCGQTFRFVSDFSRHKRKTGHTTKKGRG